jgi:hypothetical protein
MGADFELVSMSKMRGAASAACLIGLLLAGCSRPVPPSPALTTAAPDTCTTKQEADKATDNDADKANRRSAKGKHKKANPDTNLAYATAVNECRQQATHTTMGSVLSIFTRLRPGAYDTAYKACMKSHGCDVGE